MSLDNTSSAATGNGTNDNPAEILEAALLEAELLDAVNNPGLDLFQRFKAFVRLFSLLKRRAKELSLPVAVRSVAPEVMRGPAWESAPAREWVVLALQVGECLALFEGADFTADPRVTAQDYATLLQNFLEGHGAVLRESFIAQLPYRLQDEAIVVRTLLITRCEGHGINFGRLVGESSGQQEQQERRAPPGGSRLGHAADSAGPADNATRPNSDGADCTQRQTIVQAFGVVQAVATVGFVMWRLHALMTRARANRDTGA